MNPSKPEQSKSAPITLPAYTYARNPHKRNPRAQQPPAQNPCADHTRGDVCGICGYGCRN